MRIYKKKLKDDLSDLKCDICDNSCKTKLDDYEFASLKAQWGYSSRKDGEECNLEICEDCFDKIMDFIKNIKK